MQKWLLAITLEEYVDSGPFFWFMTHEEQSRDHARDTGHVVCQDRQLHPNY